MANKDEKKTNADLMDDARQRLHRAEGDLNYLLEVLGDGIGKAQGWKNRLDGLDAVRYYLIQKHHWTPAQVQAMPLLDLRFALTEEMTGWTLPRAKQKRSDR